MTLTLPAARGASAPAWVHLRRASWVRPEQRRGAGVAGGVGGGAARRLSARTGAHRRSALPALGGMGVARGAWASQLARRSRRGAGRGAAGRRASPQRRALNLRTVLSSPRRALSNALFSSIRRHRESGNCLFCWTPLYKTQSSKSPTWGGQFAFFAPVLELY